MTRLNCILKKFIILLISLSAFESSSQQKEIDSLLISLKNSQRDTNKVKTLNLLSSLFYADAGKAFEYASEALDLASELNDKKSISSAYVSLGNIYTGQRKYAKSIEFYLKSLEIEKELNDKKRIARRLSLIAYIHRINQNPAKSLEFQLEALRLSRSIQDNDGILKSLFELKLLYEFNFHNLEKAISYCDQLLEYHWKSNDTARIVFSLKQLGRLYANTMQLPKAISYMDQALYLAKKSNDLTDESQAIWDLGSIYFNIGDYEKALEQFQLAYRTHGVERKHLIAYDIGEANYKLGNYSKAVEFFSVSLRSVDRDSYLTKDIYKILSEIYFHNMDYRNAYNYLNRYNILNDSISNNRTRTEEINKVAELQKQYDFTEIEKKHEREAKEKDLIHAANVKQQKIYIAFTVIILLIVTIFSLLVYKKYKTSQLQKKIIEQKNKEVLDSIRYAKRIQSSMLPTEKYIERSINNRT